MDRLDKQTDQLRRVLAWLGGAVAPRREQDRFTTRARQALILAQEEAERFNHNFIGTEHLLLGLLREGDGVAARVLNDLGVQLEAARGAVMFIVGRGEGPAAGEIGLTPRATRVVEFAVDEANRLHHSYIGTEHLLLGLMREGDGVGARVLTGELGIQESQVHERIMQVIATGGGRRGEAPAGPRGNVVTCRIDDRDLDALDALVEAGIKATRSEAAAWLISAGIDAHQPLFDRVYATVAEIRRLRGEARTIASEAAPRRPAAPGDAPTAPAGAPDGQGDAPGQAGRR
jgi:ATP-dependent Clp protease ATP-binding subunit ClpA